MNTNTELGCLSTAIPLSLELEQHYTVAEISEAWALSRNTVRRYFERLPGVIHLDRPETKTKRKYVTLRIPAHILNSEYCRITRRA
jgi:Fic family protein